MRIQATVAALSFSFGFASASETPACNAARADSATTAPQLRDIQESCGVGTDAHASARQRLNSFPVPLANVPQLLLRKRTDAGQAHRATYEADVFFESLEAYPPDTGLTKLAYLIDRINTGYFIERVQIVGSSAPTEESEPIARLRADFLRRYFMAAGVDPDRIVTGTRKAAHADTPEGRARDRSAAIRVVTFQQQADRPPSYEPQAEDEIKQLRAEQANLLRQIKAMLKQVDEGRPAHAHPDVLRKFDEKRAETARSLQEIENRIAQDDGPAWSVSKSLEETSDSYHGRLRRRIEQAGTEDFPRANGTPLYGTVKVKFTLVADGALKRLHITSSSGVPELDRHVARLLQRLEPFEPFPPEMKQAIDRLVVEERFNFTREPGTPR